MGTHENKVFDDQSALFIKSNTDGLYILPWKLLHDGYEVTQQETVTSVDPDDGNPITHSKFSTGGRIISAKIYVDDEPTWWYWYNRAVKRRALPCWVKDLRLKGFMRCYITEQPSLSPASNSIDGCYIQLKLFALAQGINVTRFITENTPERFVTEGEKDNFVTDIDEVIY